MIIAIAGTVLIYLSVPIIIGILFLSIDFIFAIAGIVISLYFLYLITSYFHLDFYTIILYVILFTGVISIIWGFEQNRQKVEKEFLEKQEKEKKQKEHFEKYHCDYWYRTYGPTMEGFGKELEKLRRKDEKSKIENRKQIDTSQ